MLPFEDRYTRQRQLAEVGLAGQAQLQQSCAKLGTSPPEQIAAEYLSRAGVDVVARPDVQIDSRMPLLTNQSEMFRFAGPAVVAHGTLIALCHIRSALKLR